MRSKRRLEKELAASNIPETYPDPVEHCDICSWWPVCNEQRRKDDQLSFVAGISKLQIRELQKLNANTLANLAGLSLPIRTERGSSETFEKLHEQARLQLQRRNTGQTVHDLLPLQPEHGLAKLPEPSPGDIFFDFESDPFVDIDGLQYLLGYVVLDQTGTANYSSIWSLNRIAECQAFESFIDMAMKRYKDFPNMHIYHFTHYEPTALKRLAGRYASVERYGCF